MKIALLLFLIFSIVPFLLIKLLAHLNAIKMMSLFKTKPQAVESFVKRKRHKKWKMLLLQLTPVINLMFLASSFHFLTHTVEIMNFLQNKEDNK